jgi:hypothetical protein
MDVPTHHANARLEAFASLNAAALIPPPPTRCFTVDVVGRRRCANLHGIVRLRTASAFTSMLEASSAVTKF